MRLGEHRGRGGEGWEGFNTDAPAALALDPEARRAAGQRVAVVGAGGTARAIAAALKDAGAAVTLFNRSRSRGEATAARDRRRRARRSKRCPARAGTSSFRRRLWEGTARRSSSVATSAGRFVLDAAYGAEPTPLVRAARARGLAVADGLDLLEEQGALQFERLTGGAAPRPAMAAALEPWRRGIRRLTADGAYAYAPLHESITYSPPGFSCSPPAPPGNR